MVLRTFLERNMGRKILIVDDGTKSINQITELLNTIGETQCVRVEAFNPDMVESDIVVFSGSSIYNVEFNKEFLGHLIEFIRNTDKVVVGICFGFQLLCEAYGSKLERLEKPVKDITNITLSTGQELSVQEKHKYCIKELGDDLVELARSEDGVEIVKHKEKRQIGFQFHPELATRETSGDEVFISLLAPLLD
jgi:GMP synthase-like glutamine amidotransferase